MKINQRGQALALFIIVIAGISALVMSSANSRIGRYRQAKQGWRQAAADALAQSGLLAAQVATEQGKLPPQYPLGAVVDLSPHEGRLELKFEHQEGVLYVESCAQVGEKLEMVKSCLSQGFN